MSQQRALIVALCVLGAVALASSQSLDWQNCSKAVREEADRYRKALTQAGQKFSNNMQEAGAQATDISALQSDIDKLTNSVTSLSDMSGGFDAGRFSNMYLENMQTMASMMRNSLQMYMRFPSSTMSSYIELGNAAYSSQTQFMQRVTNSCMPSASPSVQ